MKWTDYKKYILNFSEDFNFHEFQSKQQGQLIGFYKKNSSTLYFGFIENTSDECLIDFITQLQNFAQENNLKKIIGPIDGNTWNNYRFQDQIEISIPYSGQPSYTSHQKNIFIKNGFIIKEKYETLKLKNISALKSQIIPFYELKPKNLKYAPMTLAILNESQKDITNLLNEIFESNIGYHKISSQESEIIISGLSRLLHPDYSYVAYSEQQKIVGFLMCFKKDSDLFIKTIGFTNKERHQGLSALSLIAHLFKNSPLDPIQNFYVCLMRENNFPSLISSEFLDQKNTYVLLEKDTF